MSQAFILSSFLFYQTLQNSTLLSIPQDTAVSNNVETLNENYLYNPLRVGITKDADALAPVIEAKAALVMDVKTQAILYQKNAYVRLPIASITKLFTTMVLLDQNLPLDKLITVDQYAADMPASKIYLKKGDRLTLHNLLQASLVASANDATMTLVQGVLGGPEKAVNLVNQKTHALGFINTHIAHPLGFDDKENYSTAFEIAKAAFTIVTQYPTVLDIAKQGPFTITSSLGNTYAIKPTNQLLNSYIKIQGLKTGTTPDAGESFVSLGTYHGHQLITVVLNSPDRFQETKVLYEWANKHYHWQ